MDRKDEVEVGIGQLEVSRGSATMVARSLGSCVALALYDEDNEVGGLAHVLVAEGDKEKKEKPAMYADRAVKRLKRKISELGGRKRNLEAKIAGGAQMFSFKSKGAVGEKNVEAVVNELNKQGINIVGRDTGGDKARTVRFKVGSMSMKVEIKI